MFDPAETDRMKDLGNEKALGASVSTEAPWQGFLRDETVVSKGIVPGVTLHHLTGTLPTGPVQMHLVDVDLTSHDIHIDALSASGVYLSDEAQWSRQTVSELVRESGAVVGINANFFEMNATHNPRGMHISRRQLLKSHNARWHSAVYFDLDGKPHFGKLHWNGGIRRVGDAGMKSLAGLNITTAGPDGITLFRRPWRRSPGRDAKDDSGHDVVELILTNVTESAGGPTAALAGIWGDPKWIRGSVKEVRVDQPGCPVNDSRVVVSGKGEGARYLLENFAPGDQVEACHGVGGESYWPFLRDWHDIRACVCGNVMLLRNGRYCDDTIFTDDEIHPRTLVAATQDQLHVYFIVVDGRSEASVGMTYKQAADFLLSMGAVHAINLDGGGSSALAIWEAGADPATVVNVPSDGSERPVPDGLAVFYRE